MPRLTLSKPSGRSVALLVEMSNRYSRELLHGIRSFMQRHGGWTVHLTEHGRGAFPPSWLARWKGHGIIARIENSSVEEAVRAARVPVVNVSAAGLAPEFPSVISDSAAIARLAAEHFFERQLRHFGYCGDGRFAWSRRHGDNFAEYLAERGHGCSLFESAPEDFTDWESERRKLEGWIRSLPKPVGVMACYDIRGQQVLDVCRQMGVGVPEEVAVVGQHNDELLCELCDPPLSSVIPNARRAGHDAAALLDRMMRGERIRRRTYVIEPLGVATRRSTDVLAVDDRQVATAVRFIRENACRGIGVKDVLELVPMSRTLFERRFRQLIGRAPYEEIRRVRLRRVCELLAATDLRMSEIAEETGFSAPEYLSAAFRREIGINPKDYRRRNSARGAGISALAAANGRQ